MSVASAALEQAHAELAEGRPSAACERLRSLLGTADETAAIRHAAALAHARIGALVRASELLAPLLAELPPAPLDCEVLALSGRIAKDRARRAAEPAARARFLAAALERYLAAWKRAGDPYPGVNAASLLRLVGDLEGSRRLATKVMGAAATMTGDPLWQTATLGELCLLLGDEAAAERHYRAAAEAARGRHGDLAAMRRQLGLLGREIPAAEALRDLLTTPPVIVFSGHLIDRPGRASTRFPESASGALAEVLRERLRALGPAVVYSSAACGADLLLCEALAEVGGESHLVLPFAIEDFRAASVAYAGEHWSRRFDAALARASSVSFAVSEHYRGDDALFEHAGELMQGAAVLHARQFDTEARMLAVLDPRAPALRGGTRALVEQWRDAGRPLELIDLHQLLHAHSASTPGVVLDPPAAGTIQASPGALGREVRSMLFADMVGFSRLEEEDTSAYLQHFLGRIAELLRHAAAAPVALNTWGDGLFMVFERLGDAAGFALALRDSVRGTAWSELGLPAGTGIRIALHTGPVLQVTDPLTGAPNCFGSHVVKAARIEPVTPAGEVFVSDACAMLLSARRDHGLAVDYVGRMPLAKGHPPAVLYRLRREANDD